MHANFSNRWLGPVPHVIKTALALRRSDASFHQFVASPVEADLVSLGEMLADSSVVPTIDRVIGLDDVASGLIEIGTGHAKAKIAVQPA